MKVVAFLQCQWFRDPERVRGIIERRTAQELAGNGDGMTAAQVREEYISYFLFAGCLTGKRLRAALGEEWKDRIVWEEVSREIGGKSSSCFPAYLEHIHDVIARHQPRTVIAFGKVASDALRSIEFNGILLHAPHPTARFPDVMDRLREVRFKLDHEAE